MAGTAAVPAQHVLVVLVWQSVTIVVVALIVLVVLLLLRRQAGKRISIARMLAAVCVVVMSTGRTVGLFKGNHLYCGPGLHVALLKRQREPRVVAHATGVGVEPAAQTDQKRRR